MPVKNIDFEITPIAEADIAICDAINTFFLGQADPGAVDNEIENQISKYLEVFKDDIYCLIEYPYVDKFYRDSYYSYYSSKHTTYKRDCIRVSLFTSEITHDDFLTKVDPEGLNSKFVGYFVIRPTLGALIGRSVINPLALEDNSFKICSCKAVSFVLGVRLETSGFPHSSQDRETILCAETTIWALMEYFSNRYPDYKPVVPSQIHSTLKSVMYERQLPSRGLTMDQISFALKEFGFGTRIYSVPSYRTDISNIIDCYIESGIPLLVGLGLPESVGHVVVCIGKHYEGDYEIDELDLESFTSHGRDKSFVNYTSFPKKFVVQDDNLAPYQVIDIANPMIHYEEEDLKYLTVDSIIVPLYSKIYLEAEVAKELFLQIIKDEQVGHDFEEGFVFRYFLASSRSFKNHISQSAGMTFGLKYNVVSAKMPKFIWCAEIYAAKTRVNYASMPIGLMVLDATETKAAGINSLIFASYSDGSVYKNENKFVYLQDSLNNYTYYSNLK